MQTIITAELMSAIFIIVSLLSQFSDKSKLKSTGALKLCSILLLVWLCADAGAYSLNGPKFPLPFLWLLNFLSYTLGGFVFVAFVRYCKTYISERTSIKKWVFLVPVVVTVINEVILITMFLAGKLIVFENGTAVDAGSIPSLVQILNILIILYLPIAALTKKKDIGGKAVSLLGLYGFAPIIAIILVSITGLDFTLVLGAVSVVTVATLLQKDEANKHVLELNEKLEKANYTLQQLTEDQEAQLQEISGLNAELEERQAQLEESSAEQEAQLEEIESLNEKLRQKQSYTDTLYEKLLKVQACGIVSYKVPSYEILVMNDMARKMYGLPLTGVIDTEKLFSHIKNAKYDNEEETRANLKKIKNPGDQYSFSMWRKNEQGKDVHIYVTTQLIQMDNGEHVIVSSLLDTTEITNMEIANARAKAESDAKTSFLFNMSHDIRTPMNAIIGFRNLLEKHQEDAEKRSDYLKKIEESSNVLLSIINNVLEMSRIEKGAVEIDETAWSAEQFNDTIYSIFHEMMTGKGIKFTRQIVVQNPYVYCDTIKLREIFINILSNAYKYTDEGGSVNMHLEEIPSDKEGYALYQTTITDTGIGMSKEFLPHIFEEFARENNTTDNKVEGTGLGMPIVKRLVELMDGTIEVQSVKGEGSTFIVTIPHKIAERSKLVQHEGVEIDPKLFEGKRVLLAEDNEFNAEIAIEMLEEAGFIVERAEDGQICYDKLNGAAAGYYHIILMDIQMPNMNGYEATINIRKIQDSIKANIPILAMTANAFEEDKREALRVGMNGHIAKPVRVPELMKVLAGMLSKE